MGKRRFLSERSSISKNRAPGMCSARYSFFASRPAVGRCQLPSSTIRSGEDRWLASQSVSTIQFLAVFGKEFPTLEVIAEQHIGKTPLRRKLAKAHVTAPMSFFPLAGLERQLAHSIRSASSREIGSAGSRTQIHHRSTSFVIHTKSHPLTSFAVARHLYHLVYFTSSPFRRRRAEKLFFHVFQSHCSADRRHRRLLHIRYRL